MIVEKRQISCAKEFMQIFHSQGGHHTALRWVWHLNDFLPRRTEWEGGKSDFVMEKSDKNYPSQVIKVTINSDESYEWYVPLKWCDKNSIWSFLPKIHNPSPIMRKASDKSWWSDFLQNTCPVFLRIVKLIQNNESPKICNSPKPKGTWTLNVRAGIL